MVMNAYKEQEIALLTQRILHKYTCADICHMKGMLIAEKQFLNDAECLEKKLQALKGFKLEPVEEPDELKFEV